MSRIKSKFKRTFLSPPHMSGKELNLVKEAFDSNYVAPLGPMVDAFKCEFSDKVRTLYAVAVSSETADMPRLNTPQLNSQDQNPLLRCKYEVK